MIITLNKSLALLPVQLDTESVDWYTFEETAVYAAIGYGENFAFSIYIPPLWPNSLLYNKSYIYEDSGNRFPGGFKLQQYNDQQVDNLLDTLPPGDDFFMYDLCAF
jgi:hypothetical protein